MATLAQLESQIRKLQRRADALRERKSMEIIADIRALMQEYGLTMADLVKAGLGKKRGRPAGSGNAAAKSRLPPKYRDPVSGATWSGHARPPSWIKDAPDRSVYLIDGPGDAKSFKSNAAKADAAPNRRPYMAKTPRKSAQRAIA